MKREFDLRAKYHELKKLFDAEKKSRDEEREKHFGELAKLREENRSLQIAMKEKDDILVLKDGDLLVRKTYSICDIF